MIKEKFFDNKNKNNWCTKWNVVVKKDGGRLGHTVTFYDMTQQNFPDGQNVATYYVNTIIDHNNDLCLYMDVDFWRIAKDDLKEIREWLKLVSWYFELKKESKTDDEIYIIFKNKNIKFYETMELFNSGLFHLIDSKNKERHFTVETDTYREVVAKGIDDFIIKYQNYDNIFLYDGNYILWLKSYKPHWAFLYSEEKTPEITDLFKIENSIVINVDDLGFRKCSECGKLFQEGYIVDDGYQYYCSEKCLYENYSASEYDEMYKNDVAYYTEWGLDNFVNFDKL